MSGQPGTGSIAIDNLSHTYLRHGSPINVLSGVELNVDAGAYVLIVGPSGSGKSTLFAILGGLERPQSGEVSVGGTNLTGLSGDDLAYFRRTTVGFVFQHFGLLEAFTASENVEIAGGVSVYSSGATDVGGDAKRRCPPST